jgi:hypothetical protein
MSTAISLHKTNPLEGGSGKTPIRRLSALCRSEMKDAPVKLRNGTTIKGWLDGADRVDELQTIGFETMSWRQLGS